MALHTELPIHRTGVRLLDLAAQAQRPGSEEALNLPSRRGDRLYWPGGRVTNLDGGGV